MSVEDFREYCCSFYSIEHEKVIYPIATTAAVRAAATFVAEWKPCCDVSPDGTFNGDTFDREAVRGVLQAIGFAEIPENIWKREGAKIFLSGDSVYKSEPGRHLRRRQRASYETER